MRIPAVQLEVPVFAGTSDVALTHGAGRIEGTPVLGNPGNTGIAAHRDGWFRVLKDVRVGDAVEIETLQGEMRFRITETSVVEPADLQVLAPTEQHSLTLVTCYPFYFVGSAPQHYIVRAVRI
jgi:sortase A